ncbi:Fc.00g083250.m01.CDS01 [Cosmosporella sp. VM-42]
MPCRRSTCFHLMAGLLGTRSVQSSPLEKLKAAVELAGILEDATDVSYLMEHEAAVRAALFDHKELLGGVMKDAAIYSRVPKVDVPRE